MSELFPVVAGLLCGVLIGSMTTRRRLTVGVASAVVAGVLATVLSGEWRLSWAFVLVDVSLVAMSAAVGVLVSRRVTARRSIR